jgi:hypothetical protein
VADQDTQAQIIALRTFGFFNSSVADFNAQ